MKKIIFNKNFQIFICLLSLTFTNAQDKKQATATLFGQQIKTETINPENGIIKCASTEYEKFLQGNDSNRMTDAQFEAWINPLIAKYKALQMVSSQTGGIITIPVVVHVIHNGQAVGTAPNITDSQVESQITVMNNDFRRLTGTPGFNTNTVGVDTQIQFALAQQDPIGNPTNGINRVNLCQASWSTDAIDATVKPATIWDPALYLNMWSVDFSDNTLLGYAQFPDASGLAGLNFSGGAANKDGVVAAYSTFGSVNYSDGTFLLIGPYNEGRTMTHEVGHWIGLRHIWGDGSCASDFCADTPTANTANFGCPIIVNCESNGNEMVQNYMDYSDDACMNIYTQNQKDRMIVIMNNATRRSTLKTSTKDLPITLFANDAEAKLEPNCASANGVSCANATAAFTQKVTIYNRGTSTLTSATLNYNFNGGAANSYTWTGSLATHKFVTFNMPLISPVNGTINVSIANANGVTDQRTTNNSASTSYTVPTPPTNYAFNTVVFRLQRDKFGSEITWTVKNSTGTILYSGGPYSNTPVLPTLITQNWTLASNQCYTFTINDSSGDGICCTKGNGYYDIKNGATVIASGASYGTIEAKAFSINLLSTEQFVTFNDMYLYPNPAKGSINIAVPNGLELPDSFTIFNTIGQVITKMSVNSAEDLIINTAAYSNGVYFITMVRNNEKKTLRFIKE